MNKNVYVTKPFLPPLDDFIPYLEEIWSSGVLTNCGAMHQKLESALAEYLGVKYVSLFSNGTIALIAALKTLRVRGEVITTPYSFVATAHSIVWNGLTPIFVDIDPETTNIDSKKLVDAITPNTTAILPVHCYGNRCDVDKIQEIADYYDLSVIYDAAHAFGINDSGGSILRHGDLSVVSFHATKVFNTFEGGAIISHDLKTKSRIDRIKNFGFVDETNVSSVGINGKMSEINAAFGLLQLNYMSTALSKRQVIDSKYRNGLDKISGIGFLTTGISNISNYSYFPILVKEEFPVSRDELFSRLKSSGVFARRYFYPLISDFSMYRSYASSVRDNLPVATYISDGVICLPIYPDLELSSVDRVISVIVECAKV